MGNFGTCPTPEPAKRLTFNNTVITGAGVAFHQKARLRGGSLGLSAPVFSVRRRSDIRRRKLGLCLYCTAQWEISREKQAMMAGLSWGHGANPQPSPAASPAVIAAVLRSLLKQQSRAASLLATPGFCAGPKLLELRFLSPSAA
jgi:hypothetical protein